jgi:hypothetical protein
VRGQENTVDHCNQVRIGKEEKRWSDRSIFKLVVGGSNILWLAPNLVSLFLTLSTLIWLHSLGFGTVEVQIWGRFYQFDLPQFWETELFR